MGIAGKSVLVTGANGGIGSLIAEKLAANGAHVILVGRDTGSLQTVAQTITASGGKATAIPADLLKAEDRERLVEHCQQLSTGLFGLINNAGSNHCAFLPDQSEAMLQNQLHLNLLVPMLLTRALLPVLQKEQGARILNVGSTFGSIGYPGYAAYCASKFGLRGFTESLRREMADTDIKVLYIAPRATATKLNADNVVAMNSELGNAMDPPDKVAAAIAKVFMDASPHQSWLGWPEKLFVFLNQLLPAAVDGALKKQLPVIRRHTHQSR